MGRCSVEEARGGTAAWSWYKPTGTMQRHRAGPASAHRSLLDKVKQVARPVR